MVVISSMRMVCVLFIFCFFATFGLLTAARKDQFRTWVCELTTAKSDKEFDKKCAQSPQYFNKNISTEELDEYVVEMIDTVGVKKNCYHKKTVEFVLKKIFESYKKNKSSPAPHFWRSRIGSIENNALVKNANDAFKKLHYPSSPKEQKAIIKGLAAARLPEELCSSIPDFFYCDSYNESKIDLATIFFEPLGAEPAVHDIVLNACIDLMQNNEANTPELPGYLLLVECLLKKGIDFAKPVAKYGGNYFIDFIFARGYLRIAKYLLMQKEISRTFGEIPQNATGSSEYAYRCLLFYESHLNEELLDFLHKQNLISPYLYGMCRDCKRFKDLSEGWRKGCEGSSEKLRMVMQRIFTSTLHALANDFSEPNIQGILPQMPWDTGQLFNCIARLKVSSCEERTLQEEILCNIFHAADDKNFWKICPVNANRTVSSLIGSKQLVSVMITQEPWKVALEKGFLVVLAQMIQSVDEYPDFFVSTIQNALITMSNTQERQVIESLLKNPSGSEVKSKLQIAEASRLDHSDEVSAAPSDADGVRKTRIKKGTKKRTVHEKLDTVKASTQKNVIEKISSVVKELPGEVKKLSSLVMGSTLNTDDMLLRLASFQKWRLPSSTPPLKLEASKAVSRRSSMVHESPFCVCDDMFVTLPYRMVGFNLFASDGTHYSELHRVNISELPPYSDCIQKRFEMLDAACGNRIAGTVLEEDNFYGFKPEDRDRSDSVSKLDLLHNQSLLDRHGLRYGICVSDQSSTRIYIPCLLVIGGQVIWCVRELFVGNGLIVHCFTRPLDTSSKIGKVPPCILEAIAVFLAGHSSEEFLSAVGQRIDVLSIDLHSVFCKTLKKIQKFLKKQK